MTPPRFAALATSIAVQLLLMAGCSPHVAETADVHAAPKISELIMREVTKTLSSDGFEGRALATTDDWPNWAQGDEFRSIRDASRAAQ